MYKYEFDTLNAICYLKVNRTLVSCSSLLLRIHSAGYTTSVRSKRRASVAQGRRAQLLPSIPAGGYSPLAYTTT